MSDWDYTKAVYKEALDNINKLIRQWRRGKSKGLTGLDDFDYLYEIEGLVDEVGLE